MYYKKKIHQVIKKESNLFLLCSHFSFPNLCGIKIEIDFQQISIIKTFFKLN